jgi:hypothetical protein
VFSNKKLFIYHVKERQNSEVLLEPMQVCEPKIQHECGGTKKIPTPTGNQTLFLQPGTLLTDILLVFDSYSTNRRIPHHGTEGFITVLTEATH